MSSVRMLACFIAVAVAAYGTRTRIIPRITSQPVRPVPTVSVASGRTVPTVLKAPVVSSAFSASRGVETSLPTSRRDMLAGGLVGALMSVTSGTQADAYDLPLLPYAYDSLEPATDKATMEFDENKHHQTYITNINNAFEGKVRPRSVELQRTAIETGPAFPKSGGAYNQKFFQLEIAPEGSGGSPSFELSSAILEAFGSMDQFKAKFVAAAAPGASFDSGWVWLVLANDGKLAITSTPNQDNPLMDGVGGTPGIPILGCDNRPDYIKAWWNIVNWNRVNRWYENAIMGKAPSVDKQPEKSRTFIGDGVWRGELPGLLTPNSATAT